MTAFNEMKSKCVSKAPRVSLMVIFTVATFAALFFVGTDSVRAQEGGRRQMIVDDSGNGEVVAFGSDVIVRSEAKNVLVFGGDVIVEGRVEEDVATVGGSVIQKESGFIGGDVFALGGNYKSETQSPQRNPGRETVVYAGYESEIREMVLNPSTILAPAMTWAFVVQRFLSVVFWFILSIGTITIAPGAVTRAVSRLRIIPLKTVALGVSGLLASTVGMVLALSFLPGYLSTVIGLMVLAILLVSYIFGRVAMQVALGKILQKAFLPETKRSETVSVLLGTVIFTVLLSVPYLWAFVLVTLFSASIGLVATARTGSGWRAALD